VDSYRHCTALHCTALHCTALHCTALHCTLLNVTIPQLEYGQEEEVTNLNDIDLREVICLDLIYGLFAHCTALHCTAPHWSLCPGPGRGGAAWPVELHGLLLRVQGLLRHGREVRPVVLGGRHMVCRCKSMFTHYDNEQQLCHLSTR
jgi:hypothetical protein